MTQNGHVGSQPPQKGSDDEDQKEDESEDENEEDSKLPAEGLGILSLDDNSVKSFRLAEWSACQSVDVKFPIEPANRPVPAVHPKPSSSATPSDKLTLMRRALSPCILEPIYHGYQQMVHRCRVK